MKYGHGNIQELGWHYGVFISDMETDLSGYEFIQLCVVGCYL